MESPSCPNGAGDDRSFVPKIDSAYGGGRPSPFDQHSLLVIVHPLPLPRAARLPCHSLEWHVNVMTTAQKGRVLRYLGRFLTALGDRKSVLLALKEPLLDPLQALPILFAA